MRNFHWLCGFHAPQTAGIRIMERPSGETDNPASGIPEIVAIVFTFPLVVLRPTPQEE
jgi:hypothetical protein